MALRKLLCLVLIFTCICGGCALPQASDGYSWASISVDAPRSGKPFVSEQLLDQVDAKIANLERSLDFSSVSIKAETDSRVRSLYDSYLLHKTQHDVKTAKRNSVLLLGDKLDILSSLLKIEGYLFSNQSDFSALAIDSADRFDAALESLEERYLSLSHQEEVSVESAAFLMGAEHILATSKGAGEDVRSEVAATLPQNYHDLNRYPTYFDVALARQDDMYQTAEKISKDATMPLARAEVIQLRDKLWKMRDQLLHHLPVPSQRTINWILFDNLERLGNVSKERADLTYASLRLALHSVLTGKLLEKINAELGQVPAEMSDLSAAEKVRIADWIRDLSIDTYNNALRASEENYGVADAARWPINNLELVHALLTADYNSDLIPILALIEVVVSSELTVAAVSLQSLVRADKITFFFENN